MAKVTCGSCGMPIDLGPYCRYCVDDHGKLQPFEERFEKMVQFMARQEPKASRADLERRTLAHMAETPAWKDHPRVRAAKR